MLRNLGLYKIPFIYLEFIFDNTSNNRHLHSVLAHSPETSGTGYIHTKYEQPHHDDTIPHPRPPQLGSKHRRTNSKANDSPTVPFSQKIKP